MISTERDLPEDRLAVFAANLDASDWTSALFAAYNPTGASEVRYETAKAALVADLDALASIRAERDAAVAALKPFAEMHEALRLINEPKGNGTELLRGDKAIFQTWGEKDTPKARQITIADLGRAARAIPGEQKHG